MKKYFLRKEFSGIFLGTIFTETDKGYKAHLGMDSWIGLPKYIVETHPSWFELYEGEECEHKVLCYHCHKPISIKGECYKHG